MKDKEPIKRPDSFAVDTSQVGAVHKTSAEITAERIRTMPLDRDYKPVPDLPIPTDLGVLIKRLPKPAIMSIKLDTGGELGLINAGGDNARDPSLGIIMAVGPRCGEYLKVGLRCYYDCNQTGVFRHNGVEYMRMDAYSVYYIVPDPSTIDQVEVKDNKEVIREKNKAKQSKIYGQISADEQNELDRKHDKTKGKNRFLN